MFEKVQKHPQEMLRDWGDQTLINSMGLGSGPCLKQGQQASVLL